MFRKKNYPIDEKVECSLLPMMSCRRHKFGLLNCGFYHSSQQGLRRHKFVQEVSGQWTDNQILME